MSSLPLTLAFAYPDDLLDESAAKTLLELLDADERVRWARFGPERRRREFLTAHALARCALSQCRPVAPADWQFTNNPYGKPTPIPDCGIRFNLSDSHTLVACLIAEGGEVGVDVEPYLRAPEIAEIAADVFSPREVAQLKALDGPAHADRALSLWTLKEAYIKARGKGLSMPLKKFSFLFSRDGHIRLERDDDFAEEPGCVWRFCLMDFGSHRVAVFVVDDAAAEMAICEARALPSAPVRLGTMMPRWFGTR